MFLILSLSKTTHYLLLLLPLICLQILSSPRRNGTRDAGAARSEPLSRAAPRRDRTLSREKRAFRRLTARSRRPYSLPSTVSQTNRPQLGAIL